MWITKSDLITIPHLPGGGECCCIIGYFQWLWDPEHVDNNSQSSPAIWMTHKQKCLWNSHWQIIQFIRVNHHEWPYQVTDSSTIINPAKSNPYLTHVDTEDVSLMVFGVIHGF